MHVGFKVNLFSEVACLCPENPSYSHYRNVALYGQRFFVGDKPQRYKNPIFMTLWHAKRALLSPRLGSAKAGSCGFRLKTTQKIFNFDEKGKDYIKRFSFI